MSKASAPSSRRAAREAALRVLYTVDVGKQPVEEATEETLAANALDAPMSEFARALISGTLRNRADIDRTIDKFAVGFPVARQTAVDRNILRMAAAEILYSVTHAPPGAVVNEAVELAKKYSATDSGKFVNGVLGAMVREQGTENREQDGQQAADSSEGIEAAVGSRQSAVSEGKVPAPLPPIHGGSGGPEPDDAPIPNTQHLPSLTTDHRPLTTDPEDTDV